MPRRRALLKKRIQDPGIRVVISIGDAAGIGPEVIVKALSQWAYHRSCDVLITADPAPLKAISHKLRIPLVFERVASPDRIPAKAGVIPCYFTKAYPKKYSYGRSQNDISRLAVDSIRSACEAVMVKKADAIVTAPVNKAALKKAGFDIPGHTEYLAQLAGVKRYEMMLVGGPLRVVLVTRHTAIQDVSQKITKDRVKNVILLTIEELRRSFGIKTPRLVVCGLNPHAGEEGTIGKEEIREIIPGVKAAQKASNAIIVGPFAGDALFYDAYQGRYDAEICMYHDQGLIPLKMISRGHGVNVTLGLPFVRTSPDHGTAYDIAGKGVADPGSMIEAMKLAVSIVQHRRKNPIVR